MRKTFGLTFGGAGPVDVMTEFSPAAVLEYRHRAGALRYCSTEHDARGQPLLQIHGLDGGNIFRLTFGDGTTFVLDRRGTWVKGSWTEDSTLADTLIYFLGPVAGALLYLRGITCLHASAIVVRGKALVFVGASEAGKSTTAGAFAKLGFSVITDDIAALSERDGVFLVQPGAPRILLWPPSVEAIWGSADALPLVVPNWEKRYLDLCATGLFQETPVPLGAVYVLEERAARGGIGISPLSGAGALMQLIANRYFTRFSEPHLEAREFADFSRLQHRVPLRRVARPDDRSSIGSVCEAILRDFDRLAARSGAFDASCV
jgi:hypothetical protein